MTATPTAHDLVVHAVLDAGSRDQYVIVQTTDGAISRQVAVTGATVTMTLPNGVSVTAAEEANDGVAREGFDEPEISRVYHFSLDRLGIALVPGGTYQLRVAVPDGRVATGHTTIPVAAAVAIDAETLSVDRMRDTLRTVVMRVPGAAKYEVDMTRALDQNVLLRVFSDTVVSLPGTMDAFRDVLGSAPSAVARVTISALDPAYYAYVRRSGDPLSGIGATGNLTGALGVFGSIVELKRFAVIVK